jgi:hypothetical protein
MYQSVNFTDFRDAFRNHDRLDQFSYEGSKILFDYLEQYEQDTGEKIELDVIAICCDFVEVTEEEVRDSYSLGIDENVEEYLWDNTSLCGSYKNNAGENVYIFKQF